MGRTDVDKYRRIISNYRRGYCTGAYVVHICLDKLMDSPGLLDEFLAVSPPEIAELLSEWVNGHPTDNEGWQSWMKTEHFSIPSGGKVTEEEKQKTRSLVERMRESPDRRIGQH